MSDELFSAHPLEQEDEVVRLIPDDRGVSIYSALASDENGKRVAHIYNVGLGFATVNRLLRSVNCGDKFTTDDGSLKVLKNRDGSLTLTFDSHGIAKARTISASDAAKMIESLSRLYQDSSKLR